jgi:hypothetical protein
MGGMAGEDVLTGGPAAGGGQQGTPWGAAGGAARQDRIRAMAEAARQQGYGPDPAERLRRMSTGETARKEPGFHPSTQRNYRTYSQQRADAGLGGSAAPQGPTGYEPRFQAAERRQARGPTGGLGGRVGYRNVDPGGAVAKFNAGKQLGAGGGASSPFPPRGGGFGGQGGEIGGGGGRTMTPTFDRVTQSNLFSDPKARAAYQAAKSRGMGPLEAANSVADQWDQRSQQSGGQQPVSAPAEPNIMDQLEASPRVDASAFAGGAGGAPNLDDILGTPWSSPRAPRPRDPSGGAPASGQGSFFAGTPSTNGLDDVLGASGSSPRAPRPRGPSGNYQRGAAPPASGQGSFFAGASALTDEQEAQLNDRFNDRFFRPPRTTTPSQREQLAALDTAGQSLGLPGQEDLMESTDSLDLFDQHQRDQASAQQHGTPFHGGLGGNPYRSDPRRDRIRDVGNAPAPPTEGSPQGFPGRHGPAMAGTGSSDPFSVGPDGQPYGQPAGSQGPSPQQTALQGPGQADPDPFGDNRYGPGNPAPAQPPPGEDWAGAAPGATPPEPTGGPTPAINPAMIRPGSQQMARAQQPQQAPQAPGQAAQLARAGNSVMPGAFNPLTMPDSEAKNYDAQLMPARGPGNPHYVGPNQQGPQYRNMASNTPAQPTPGVNINSQAAQGAGGMPGAGTQGTASGVAGGGFGTGAAGPVTPGITSQMREPQPSYMYDTPEEYQQALELASNTRNRAPMPPNVDQKSQQLLAKNRAASQAFDTYDQRGQPHTPSNPAGAMPPGGVDPGNQFSRPNRSDPFGPVAAAGNRIGVGGAPKIPAYLTLPGHPNYKPPNTQPIEAPPKVPQLTSMPAKPAGPKPLKGLKPLGR